MTSEAAHAGQEGHAMTPEAARAKPAAFAWDDPFLLEEQLTEEERMVRDSARDYAQGSLAPRVLEANRHERFDRAIMTEMGALGLLGPTIPEDFGGAGVELRRLRADRARDRAGRFRLPLGDERAVVAGDAPDLRLRHRRAAARSTCRSSPRGELGRLLRPDRARPRLRSRRHDHPGARRSTAATRSPAPRPGSPTRRSPMSSWSGRSRTRTAAGSTASCSSGA